MKVLIVDDIEDSVKGIYDYCEEKDWDPEICGFDDVYTSIAKFNPDVIVLDWRDDDANSDVGEEILNNIWSNSFRPLVVFSANEAIINIQSKLSQSSMLKLISKGDETPVIEFLQKIEAFTTALAKYRADLSNALIAALNSIEHIKSQPNFENDAVSYILSKRTSTFFDDAYIGELSPSWVQYLCPPINNTLCVCDIIRKTSQGANYQTAGSPEEYAIILTPSCDMYHDNNRRPKVTHVLYARCFPKELFHGKTLSASPSNSGINSVRAKLNAGFDENYVALPSFSNVIPYMTVDFKKIDVVAIDQIASSKEEITDSTKFVRVASICSPFREQIVWAYMQSSCRPGVPQRNTELWAKEILTI